MANKRPMPPIKGCKDGDGFRGDKHKWQHSSSWNGNSKRVLPFSEHTHGIARSGWRCYHCGEFRWDESDESYALSFAYYAGYLPYEIKEYIRTGKPFQIVRNGTEIITIGRSSEDEKAA